MPNSMGIAPENLVKVQGSAKWDNLACHDPPVTLLARVDNNERDLLVPITHEGC